MEDLNEILENNTKVSFTLKDGVTRKGIIKGISFGDVVSLGIVYIVVLSEDSEPLPKELLYNYDAFCVHSSMIDKIN